MTKALVDPANKAKKKLGIRDFPSYDTNPAWSNLILKTRNKIVSISSKSMDVINPDTGEVAGSTTGFLGVRKRVDKEEFIKVYRDTAKQLAGLDQHGGKVFWYVMNASKINDDSIYFDAEECMEFVSYKAKSSVWNGLIDLLNKQVLFKSKKQHIYYINPAFLFNGDRLMVATDYVVKGSAIDKALKYEEDKKAKEEFNRMHPLFETPDESK